MSMDYLKEKDIVYRAFNTIQQETKKQEQFAEILANTYLHYPETFVKQFGNCVYTVLAYKGSGKEVDNLLQFISTVVSRCSGDSTVPILAPLIIDDLLNFTKTKERYVRQRCLLLINQILQKSKVLDLEISLLDKLKSCFIERSRDKTIAVRNAAASGLCRLQNPLDPDEEILKLIAENIRCESNVSTRLIYASNIMIHPLTTQAIIDTLRDEELTIRIAILKNIDDHSLFHQLSIELKHSIIHCLEDRNDIIIKSAEHIILFNWAQQNSILELLSQLNLENEEIAGELLLNAIFLYEFNKKEPVFSSQVHISPCELTPLSSFFLYYSLRFAFEHQQENGIDQLIGDIPQFCNSVKDFASNQTIDFSIQQQIFYNQIRCLQYLDTTDEVCRNAILSLIRSLLTISSSYQKELILNHSIIYSLLQALLGLLDTESLFIYEISFILSDIEDIIEDGSWKNTSYSLDNIALLSLYLVQSTFQLISTQAFKQPEIQTFFDKVIRVNIESPTIQLRQEAVRGIVLMAIMNQEIARQYISLLLYMAIEEDEDEEVQFVALQGLTDIVLVHGDMSVTYPEEVTITVKEIVEAINRFVFHSIERLQSAACESLCKLFIFDKIRSIPDISNLFLLLFDSSTEKRPYLRQILSVFFPSFCNPEIDRNCLLLEETVIYTMKGIAEASIPDRYSMLVPMSLFFLALMTVNNKKSEKRQYLESDDENEDENGEVKPNSEYHKCVYEFIEKIIDLANTKLDDALFIKEIASILSNIDGYLMIKEKRCRLNNLILTLHSNIDNQIVKRILKAKNKALCAMDPSLSKL